MTMLYTAYAVEEKTRMSMPLWIILGNPIGLPNTGHFFAPVEQMQSNYNILN